VSRLTNLIEERLTVMTDVARAKWNTGSAIEDPQREQQLLAEVVAQAQKDGIPTGLTGSQQNCWPFWRGSGPSFKHSARRSRASRSSNQGERRPFTWPSCHFGMEAFRRKM
jgi:hypothetical protein